MPVDRWILFYGYLPEDQVVMVQFIVPAASYHDEYLGAIESEAN